MIVARRDRTPKQLRPLLPSPLIPPCASRRRNARSSRTISRKGTSLIIPAEFPTKRKISQSAPALIGGQAFRELDRIKKRRNTESSEGAIDQAPEDGNLPEMAADESEGEDEKRAPDTDLEDAKVSHRIAVGEDEEKGDHQVREGKPIGAVGDERVGLVGRFKSFADFKNPLGDTGVVFGIEAVTSAGHDRGHDIEFVEQRKGGDSTENKTDKDEEDGCAYFLEVGHDGTTQSNRNETKVQA
jgi:hypothetical protein